jgi:pimeloyl-ACP methyl ester carboxylesterase
VSGARQAAAGPTTDRGACARRLTGRADRLERAAVRECPEQGRHHHQRGDLLATNTAASAARFYYENKHAAHPTEPTTIPIGLASFAYDFRPIRKFAERDHANIVSWTVFDRGGHWAAHDAPDLLIGDIRQFFRRFR